MLNIMPQKLFRCQSGCSMLEMLGVLAIAGVISIGSLKGFSMAMATANANKSLSRLSEIASGIYELYANRNNYEGISLSLIANAGIIAEDEYYALDPAYPTDFTANLAAGYISRIGRSTVTTPEGTKKYFFISFIAPLDNKVLCRKTFEWANTYAGHLTLRKHPKSGMTRTVILGGFPVPMSNISTFCSSSDTQAWEFLLNL
jgi:type II secretory pathway pseudopilin PulG